MKKISKKIINEDGTEAKVPVELKDMLNYGIADLLNKAVLTEDYMLPVHHCNPAVYPDFIALNTEPGKFSATKSTALAFYSYDRTFDRINGLYNAIYYNDKRLLDKYSKRYEGIKFVIAPDYSLFDDIWEFENVSRLFKIRILMLWFVINMHAVVIPNAVYLSADKLPMYYNGLESCTVMCYSVKGHVRLASKRRRVKENVKYVVDHFPLKTILIYSVCGKDETALELFNYAKAKGVNLIIVDNTLRQRNRALLGRQVKL